MIDWFNLLANSLWVFGLALALATLSYASWQASHLGETLRTRLGRPDKKIFLNLAGMLFSAGLAASSQRWWEMGLWLLLTGAFLVQNIMLCLAAHRNQ